MRHENGFGFVRRVCRLAAAALALAIGGCGGGAPDDVAGLDYVNPAYRFAMNVPPGWTVREGSGMPAVFVTGPRMAEGFQANVSVVVESVHPGMTLEEYVASYKLELEVLRELKLLSEEPRERPGGRKTYVLTYRQGAFSVPLTQRQLYLVAGERAYVVTATVPSDSFAGEEANFEVCFQSFRAGW